VHTDLFNDAQMLYVGPFCDDKLVDGVGECGVSVSYYCTLALYRTRLHTRAAKLKLGFQNAQPRRTCMFSELDDETMAGSLVDGTSGLPFASVDNGSPSAATISRTSTAQ